MDGGILSFMKPAKAAKKSSSRIALKTGTPCPGCGRVIAETYCDHCGELRADRHDYSVRHFLGNAVEAFTSVDNKLGRTLRALLLKPGELTAAFMNGLRKPFVAPLQLFLVSNVVFFLLNSLAGFNTFTTPLFTHLYRLPYSRIARDIAIPYIAGRNIPLSEYAVRFDAAAALQAKSLIIIMVPIFALFVWTAYWRARRFFVQHLVFSLHFFSFLLLTTSVLQAVTLLLLGALAGTGFRPSDSVIDNNVTLLQAILIGVYLYHALSRLYHEPRPFAIAKALVLTFAVGVSLTAYRFILFFITLYTT